MRQSGTVRVVVLLIASFVLAVAAFAVKGIEGDLRALEQRDLESRAASVRDYVVTVARTSVGGEPVVTAANTLHSAVRANMSGQGNLDHLAANVARADVRFGFGQSLSGSPGRSLHRPQMPRSSAIRRTPEGPTSSVMERRCAACSLSTKLPMPRSPWR